MTLGLLNGLVRFKKKVW